MSSTVRNKLKMCNSTRLSAKVDDFFGGLFETYGRFIARHPWKTIVIVVIVDLGLGVGLVNLKQDTSIEQYAPIGSTSMKNRELIQATFNMNTSVNFYAHHLTNTGKFAIVIVRKKDGGNMLDSAVWSELTSLRNYIADTSITYEGNVYKYIDICARRLSSCVVDGDYIFKSDFTDALSSGNITFPIFSTITEFFTLDDTFGSTVSTGGLLTFALTIKFKFNLANIYENRAKSWEDAFLQRIKSYSSTTFNVVYAHSRSLDEELNSNVSRDIVYFLVTFNLMITFAGLVLLGGNCVSNRFIIGMAGILSTLLSIVAALGFVSAIGVLFATIVGIVPFLVIGVGVDDMFILLSGLAGMPPDDDIETRIGKTMRTSGVAVTITSLTDVVAFCAGASSVFPAVRNFSWFAGTAILFCYFNHLTFYLGCLTVNERRIAQNRHFITFRITKSRDEMLTQGASSKDILCCAGTKSKQRQDIEGPLEKYPKKLIHKIVLFTPAKIIILVLSVVCIAVSVYGAWSFETGLDQRDLVTSDSYFYSFYEINSNSYDFKYTISLNVKSGVNYRSTTTLNIINSLLDSVKKDFDIDDTFFLSWLHAYMSTSYFDNSSSSNFISGLQTFLATTSGNVYIDDVITDGNDITASRFHVLTKHITTPTQEADMMTRVRQIAESSSLPIYDFAPPFVLIEQWLVIGSQTLQTLGICVGVMFVEP